ncbi:hypothetical protein BS47DRAFT_1372866 [Hydnum rufescens UP504]|uniref:PPM-type phosphatase domain-containing protein n=1 Tax=Hydnum rufescens UP504 TaxID=1448309 RepID=A0A9P6AUY9_9AGAM|nr:hypothetical protein BS47DRAFT_1372866 [Hydnum rufescens UP504]
MSRPSMFSDSPNARSKTITTAPGPYTHGALNQHPSQPFGYSIGLSEDTGSRRTMEDAHSFVADFAGVRGQGYFAVFDGHAGKHAAEWCGAHFHEYLLDALDSDSLLASGPSATGGTTITGASTIPDVLNKTFHNVDAELSRMADEGQTHSGCTAVTAFLRLEDDHGRQPLSFVRSARRGSIVATTPSTIATTPSGLSITGAPPSTEPESIFPRKASADADPVSSPLTTNGHDLSANIFSDATRKVLYTANAGDARAVLSRGGRAIRLTYDHKGSDAQEARRIKEAGGFVMNNRVNGVLAVTRSLGDSSMKEFVVGSPYTTETELGDEDDLLIIACDGLWDVIEDQAAVDLIRNEQDPQVASKRLVDYALKHFSTDNISVLVVRFHPSTSSPS